MRRCFTCKKNKSLDEFSTNGFDAKGAQRYKSSCKDCRREAESTKTYVRKPSNAETAKQLLIRNRRFVQNYLSTHPCVDCGEDDIVVLEFDHVRGKKVKNISMMVAQKNSLENISAEIAKCDVRCANCHRKMTAKRGNWFANLK